MTEAEARAKLYSLWERYRAMQAHHIQAWREHRLGHVDNDCRVCESFYAKRAAVCAAIRMFGGKPRRHEKPFS